MEKVITNLAQLDTAGVYTYADYLSWHLKERIELIRGKLFNMSPAPSEKHQRVSSRLHVRIGVFLLRKPCLLYSAPFDVRLRPGYAGARSPDKDVYTVVQPDLCIVCDRGKIDEQGCMGAPDLIVEILSPGNSRKEMKIKYALYEESGVREYWVVSPSDHLLHQFVLSPDGRYELKGIFAEDEVFHSHIFPEVRIDLAEVFAE